MVAGDSEIAFENRLFCSCDVSQNVVGFDRPCFRAYLVIMYAMLTYTTG